VYPNPWPGGPVTIAGPWPAGARPEIRLIDPAGKLLMRRRLPPLRAATDQLSVDLPQALPPGLYLLSLSWAGQSAETALLLLQP